MLCGTPVDAELISVNLVPGTHDRLLTYDTPTGLEWLDLTQTVNQTYDEVRTGVWYQMEYDAFAARCRHALRPHGRSDRGGRSPAVGDRRGAHTSSVGRLARSTMDWGPERGWKS